MSLLELSSAARAALDALSSSRDVCGDESSCCAAALDITNPGTKHDKTMINTDNASTERLWLLPVFYPASAGQI